MPGNSFQDSEVTAIWDEVFSRDTYRIRIAEVQANYPQDRSIVVPYDDIDSVNPDFAMYLLDKPDRCLKLGRRSLKTAMSASWDPSNDINLRITELPKDAKVDVRDLRSKHLGRLVAIEGLVRKATLPKLKMINAHFKCAKCDADIWVPQKGIYVTEPIVCPNEGCNKTALRFILDEETSVYSDTQKIEIQENPEGLRGGAQPERLAAYIEDDISGKVTPGNRITINGIIRPVEKGDRDKSIVFDVFMDVLSVEFSQMEYEEIEITEEDEEKIISVSKDPDFFNNLIKSISPTIYGLNREKEGVALQLFGGCRKEMDDGSVMRGDIHILMVGDPGVAKSQLLGYMSRLAPRGIFASGKSSSSAGLCVGGDAILTNDQGVTERIEDFVNARMIDPEEYRPGIWRQAVDGGRTQSIADLGSVRYLPITYVWKIKTPPMVYRITSDDISIILTPETKLQALKDGRFDWIEAKDLRVGDMVSTVRKNMRFGQITEMEVLTEDLPEYVYDLTIEPSHVFIASGFVVHNTAAAVKDDFGDGRFTLEAGALVLADKGLACIDELDKMTDQDRSSLHEAMESQKISVAKAGITATLQSRCSLLAAANPKQGRFDEEGKIVDQIDLPPALLSRFDLIFVLLDKPLPKRDEEITRHILLGHRRGQARAMKAEMVGNISKEDILVQTEKISPVYDADFIRKYVSYAKRNCFPVLSETAMTIIMSDYLNIRNSAGNGKSVPITARQLEAYVRLAEASAKTRLSGIVEEQDAIRAVNLVNYYLGKVAKTEDGTWDADRFESTYTQKDRDNRKKNQQDIKNVLIKSKEDGETEGLTVDEITKRSGVSESVVKEYLNTLNQNSEVIRKNNGKWVWAGQ